MTSIINAAHNEEDAVTTTSKTLLRGLKPESTEALVACNECNDAAAGRMLSAGEPVQVIEIDCASEIEALNTGDPTVHSYPHADVEIDDATITRLVEALRPPGVAVIDPIPRIGKYHSTLPVNAYCPVAIALHGQRPGDLGCGLYMMSQDGCRRFEAFPGDIADDAYARAHFGVNEAAQVRTATSVVYAPLKHFGSVADMNAQSTRNHGAARSIPRALDPNEGGHKASSGEGCLATRQGMASQAHLHRLAGRRQTPSEETTEQLRYIQLTARQFLPLPPIVKPHGRMGDMAARAGAPTPHPNEDEDTNAAVDVTGHLGQSTMLGIRPTPSMPSTRDPRKIRRSPRSHEKVLP